MTDFDFSILECPITREQLKPLSKEKIAELILSYHSDIFETGKITQGFVNESETYFYPVFDDIILLLPVYALFMGPGNDIRGKMAFDKERVFKYYNEIQYDLKNNLKIYEDSPKWVDFRDVSSDYLQNSFLRAKKYINRKGEYLLDIASGPIGLKEYVELSEHFEYRICADISINALIQAKHNYSQRKGIYICADICNIPLKDNVCDSVLCQHTLYHIPKKEQKTAVEEMVRVTKPACNVAIVYSLFYHSWFMNIMLFPVQLYRITRHFAGKLYVRINNSKPRLYFYPHSPGWFRRNFSFSNHIEFFSWRSVNKYFLDLYIHEKTGGKKILNWLQKMEDQYPKFWGLVGEYPLIVIKKPLK